MKESHPRPEESGSIDIRLLESEELPHAKFPGGRNEPFRVFFTPQVHAELWKHAGEDTTVEICGVLVGAWNRDEIGPFATITESIRGEGAKARYAEVTFTHQTWAKINSEMDSKYTALKIVGWYHTHPDFGIFLSDRDRFIHEHFFSGPGQIAHVMDPIRKIEGVFVWRGGKPTLTEHFWVGDRILTGNPAAADSSASTGGDPHHRGQVSGKPARSSEIRPKGGPGELLPTPLQLMIYAGVFLGGYLLAVVFSGWERQRFIESWVDRNRVEFLLRLGLTDQLDRLVRDLSSFTGLVEAARSKTQPADSSFGEIRDQLARAVQRVSDIKAQFGNTSAEEELLRRFLLERLAREPRARMPSAPQEARAATPESASPSK